MERQLTEKQNKFINGRLAKFLFNEYQRAQAVSLFENGKTPAEVFMIISKGKGAPSTHVSGKYKEGKVRGS